jgi:acyl-CoA synthetase (NDP forming)
MSLSHLFSPRWIALVSVCQNLSRIGGGILKYLKQHQYSGKIFPVNPRYDQIKGIQCYPDIPSIPPEIDVALVPEQTGLSVLEEAGGAKVKSAIIYSAGFSEMGEEGR